ncbi:hypothetical protein [Streptomyces sp. CT34]|uniref:hypothetical protein n=1 Tax=Streptomyces sp. CT34 TaxID=1553907 RepID=UPI0005BC85DD|nr:hypothetical protein [Streptomyces sp. CT34]
MPPRSRRTGSVNRSKRSRTRRFGESAFGMLIVARTAVMALLALLLLVAGVWTSWGTARYAMLAKGRERGTMTVAACAADRCTGPFVPVEAGGRRRQVSIAQAAVKKGERVAVALRPDSTRAVRTGAGGVLHAWVPFGGSLLLASLVVAGGIRLRRTAWLMGLLGAALLVAAFATM